MAPRDRAVVSSCDMWRARCASAQCRAEPRLQPGNGVGLGIRMGLMVAALLTAGPRERLTAQVPDTTRAPPFVTTGATVVPADTANRIRPMAAFWRSLLLPG